MEQEVKQTPVWEKYMPSYVDLYYVDYRDDLSNHLNLLEECLEKNNLYPISENIYDWWEFPEGPYLDEIKKSMEADDLEDVFEECEDEIREWLWEHDKSTPIDDLFRNTGDVLLYYSLGLDLDHGWNTAFLAQPWQNESTEMAAYKVRRALGIAKGTQAAKELYMMLDNASYGGDLRIYFNADIRDFIDKDWGEGGKDFQTIHFKGKVAVACYNPHEGSGDFCEIEIDREFPFVRENLHLSEVEHYSICQCFGCYCDQFDTNAEINVYARKPKRKVKTKVSQINKDEARFNKLFKEGKCSCDDPNMSRHRNIEYTNNIPCGWKCPHCGRFWYD